MKYKTQDIEDVINSYINWNRNSAILEMKEIKEWGQAYELLQQLEEFTYEIQLEILKYFFNHS